METLYIVICRSGKRGNWSAVCEGLFDCFRLAENLVECKKAAGSTLDYAIVEGPITNPKQMAALESELAAF